MKRSWLLFMFCVALFLSLSALGQEATPAPTPAPEAKKFVSPTQRLLAAKTVYMNNLGGSDIPFNVIQAGVESWGRYQLVDSVEKADIVVDVLSPEEEPESTATTKTKISAGGRQEQSATTKRDFTNSNIKLTVRDAHTKAALFAASEQPRGAFRTKARQDNLVQTAQSLLQKFHDRVEPPAAPAAAEPTPK